MLELVVKASVLELLELELLELVVITSVLELLELVIIPRELELEIDVKDWELDVELVKIFEVLLVIRSELKLEELELVITPSLLVLLLLVIIPSELILEGEVCE